MFYFYYPPFCIIYDLSTCIFIFKEKMAVIQTGALVNINPQSGMKSQGCSLPNMIRSCLQCRVIS